MADDRPKPPPTLLPGPGEPYDRSAGGGIVWLIPAAVVVATVLAILCGALWR